MIKVIATEVIKDVEQQQIVGLAFGVVIKDLDLDLEVSGGRGAGGGGQGGGGGGAAIITKFLLIVQVVEADTIGEVEKQYDFKLEEVVGSPVIRYQSAAIITKFLLIVQVVGKFQKTEGVSFMEFNVTLQSGK